MRRVNLDRFSTQLPAAPGAVSSPVVDLQLDPKGLGIHPSAVELRTPALGAAQLPDGATVIYALETAPDPGFTAAAVVLPGVALQTGAGAAGAVGGAVILKRTPAWKRYLRVTATAKGTGDCSAAPFVFSFFVT